MSESENKRPHRVAELIQHELASLINTELKDPRVGFVTVTEVRLSNDLRQARVYVSVYGDAAQRQTSLEGLTKAAGYLRRALSPKLQMRYTPELVFHLDDSLDRADRLHALMQAIAHGETEIPQAAPPGPVSVETDRSALADRRKEFTESERRERQKRSGSPQKPRKRRR